MKPKLSRYQAITANGASIITVLAANEDEARRAITRELEKNPSRLPYLYQWQKDGMLMMNLGSTNWEEA